MITTVRIILVLIPAFIAAHMTLAVYAIQAPDLVDLWQLSETQAAWLDGGFMLAYLPALVASWGAVKYRAKPALIGALLIAGVSRLLYAEVAETFTVAFILELLDGASAAVVLATISRLLRSRPGAGVWLIALLSVVSATISVLGPQASVFVAFVLPSAFLAMHYIGGVVAILWALVCALFVPSTRPIY